MNQARVHMVPLPRFLRQTLRARTQSKQLHSLDRADSWPPGIPWSPHRFTCDLRPSLHPTHLAAGTDGGMGTFYSITTAGEKMQQLWESPTAEATPILST